MKRQTLNVSVYQSFQYFLVTDPHKHICTTKQWSEWEWYSEEEEKTTLLRKARAANYTLSVDTDKVNNAK